MNLLRGQIILRRPPLAPPPALPVPEGYRLRAFHEGDEEHLARLVNASGFDGWSGGKFRKKALAGALGLDGVLVIEHGGKPVVTCTVLIHPRTGDGELIYTPSWLASDPAHRGKELGRVIGIECWRKAYELGYPSCEVKTDDWRLPAIGQYFQHKFIPVEISVLHRARWRLIRRLLGHPAYRASTVQFDGWRKMWSSALVYELFHRFNLSRIEARRDLLVEEILLRSAEHAGGTRRA